MSIAIILLATLGTAFLSSIFGMLGGLILMGVLASLLPVGAAMVLHGLIQLTSNGYRAWLNRKDIQWAIVATLLVGNIIALAGLAFVSFAPDRITVLLALGLLPYIAWALPKNLALDVSKRPVGIFAGLVVVATNLLAGVGGPLLDVFFQRVALTR
ncbi:MAG: sulfite exporter TauE/SafE family protein, partial [Parvibaculales bacterium]